jgi:hypothetical protein
MGLSHEDGPKLPGKELKKTFGHDRSRSDHNYIFFEWLHILFRHKPRQLIVEYYLHWTTTFERSFSGSSDTNHDSLL